MAKRLWTAALLLVAALGAVAGLAWRASPDVTAIASTPLAAPASDRESLQQALLAADAGVKSDADVLEAARLIQGAIRERPERALDLAEILPRLTNRGLAFRVALMLGAQVRVPRVRAALLSAAQTGAGPSREVAPYGFYGIHGDREVARAFAAGFGDAAAAPAVRASQAFLLSSMLADLDPYECLEARRCARAIAPDASQDKAFRAEAIGLLDAKGADGGLLREILNLDPERTVALSAARMLLLGGASESEVKAGLMRFANGGKDADLTSRSLEALLRDFGGADRGSAP